MSSMKPALAVRSWMSTALTSVAAFASCPLIVCTPLIGIHSTRSTGVLVAATTPTIVNTSSCWFFSSNASPWNGLNVSPTFSPSFRATNDPTTASRASAAPPKNRPPASTANFFPGAYSTFSNSSGTVPTIR